MRTMPVLGLAALFVLLPFRSARPADGDLTPRQKKDLEKLQSTLAKPPANPNLADAQRRAVQAQLQTFLSHRTRPAPQVTAVLATSLVDGVNQGQVSVSQSVALSRELARVLDLGAIGHRDVYALTGRIDPIIQSTTLGPSEKLRLYREALRVVQTAPSYRPDRP